jgi:hypothetical protein
VPGAVIDLKREVVAEGPAFGDQGFAYIVDIFLNAFRVRAFGGADVEPDFEWQVAAQLADTVQDIAVAPPDRRGHDGELAEDVGVLEAEVEGDEATEGGAAETGIGGRCGSAVAAIDEGFEFVDEEAAVAAGETSASATVANLGVFADAAYAGVVDTDHDEGLDGAFGDELFCGFVEAPFVAEEGGGAIEEVLTVVEIEDGKTAGWIIVLAGRQIHDDIAISGQVGGVEPPMDMDVPGESVLQAALCSLWGVSISNSARRCSQTRPRGCR